MDSKPSLNAAVHVPRLLSYADIPTAVDTSLDAFKNDPVQRYVLETPDGHDNALTRASRRTEFSALYADLIHQGTAWTIEDGASVVAYIPAKESNPGWSLDQFLEGALPFVFAYRKVLLSKEQNKRDQEVKDKMKKAIEETLGARKDFMMYITIAVTSPTKQGHGYGSALVRTITAKADEEKRSIWLMSSNTINEPFYNSLGFKVRAEILLGNDNPTWTAAPILLTLMIREYEDDSLNYATRQH